MINLPKDFVDYTRRLLGNDAFDSLAAALDDEATVSVRRNVSKCGDSLSLSLGESVPWFDGGVYLPTRPAFTFDPLFHAGCYYVQEASSMFVGRVLQNMVDTPSLMLDLCAAPGGKSTLARSVLPEGSLLVSNEIVRQRAQVLAENMIKWGNPYTIVTQNASEDFAPFRELFDVVLADVPCSGEGMFRKDEKSVAEWSTDNVDICWKRQREIIANVWSSIKQGGLLIYSTCTYNALENEQNVRWIIDEYGAEPIEIPLETEWKISGDVDSEPSKKLPVYRFFPSKLRGEGFFLAVLRKPFAENERRESVHEDNTLCNPSEGKNKKRRTGKADMQRLPVFPKEVKRWITADEDYDWQVEEGGARVVAFPKRYSSLLTRMRSELTVIHAGITVAELKGKDWVPHHALSMSTMLNREEVFPCAEVSIDVALAYLRREAVVLDASVPRGFILITYRGIPLGFVKNLGNRANNLYPQEWRIRSGHLPEESISVLE